MEKNCNKCGMIFVTEDRKQVSCSRKCGNATQRGRQQSGPRGRTACHPLFDDDDAELRSLKWTVSSRGYAKTCLPQTQGARRIVCAHRLVAERVVGRRLLSSEQCDHMNFNPLDNRRANLCIVTPAQNSQRRRYRQRNGPNGVPIPSGIKYRERRALFSPWEVAIRVRGQRLYLGSYRTLEEAEQVRMSAMREHGVWMGHGPTLADLSEWSDGIRGSVQRDANGGQ